MLGLMSQLSEYRLRIKSLLATDDVQKTLELEGVDPVLARAIGVSRAVSAQGSIRRIGDKVSEDGEENAKGKEPVDEPSVC